MKKFLNQYFYLLGERSRKKLPFLIIIFILSSILDVVGIGLISVFLFLIVNMSTVLRKLPITLQQILSSFTTQEIIFIVGSVLVLAFIFKAFFGIYIQQRISYFSIQLSQQLKMQLVINYQQAPYFFHLGQNSAYLMNKVSLVDSFINNVMSTSLNIVSSLFIVISILGCLLWMHPLITLLLSVMVFFLFFAYEIFAKNHVIKMGKIKVVTGAEITKLILQALGGLKEIRVLGKESFFIKKIQDMVNENATATAFYNSMQLIPRYAVESAASIFLVIMVFAAVFIKMDPVHVVPILGIFAAACIRLLPTVSQLISQFSQLRSSYYITDLLYEEIDLLENKLIPILEIQNNLSQQPFLKLFLQNISFRYPTGKNNVLENVDLTIHRGEAIGFIGASGAGKSTLIGIILGLLKPISGVLYVDDQPIYCLRSWLNNFAYIPQSIFLLDDTLKRNIAMGTEDQDINEQKLNHAIQMAQLSSVVEELPSGVDTVIGENGVRLSGGQRQRVALARAFYYDREIIIMDEATSSLDNDTEKEVINAIKRLHGLKTLIVVAHRLSTIQYCDVIYKLEKGNIISKGSFEEVIGHHEAFRCVN